MPVNIKLPEKALSETTQEALDWFDQAAQTWGWESDQGSGQSAAAAEESYLRAKTNLEAVLLSLEGKS